MYFARCPSGVLATLFVFVALGCDAERSNPSSVFDEAAGRWIDLSHTFDDDTIYWPTDSLGFQLEELAYGETPGGYFYSAYRFSTAEHGGTHLDAPIHFSADGRTADGIPVDQLIGTAVVVDLTASASPRPALTTVSLQTSRLTSRWPATTSRYSRTLRTSINYPRRAPSSSPCQ